MTSQNRQHAGDGGTVPLPQVIASYAAFLHARTRTTPQVTVTGDHAQVTVTTGSKTLVLGFRRRQREWSLESSELRCGEHATAFTRGRVLDAVTALLR